MAMTLQEIYDKVATHLLTQRRKAKAYLDDGTDPVCAYRGEEGCKCAIGILIADEHYATELEGKTTLQREVASALRKSGVLGEGMNGGIEHIRLNLLRDLQLTHDKHSPEHWEGRLHILAGAYKLIPLTFIPDKPINTTIGHYSP